MEKLESNTFSKLNCDLLINIQRFSIKPLFPVPNYMELPFSCPLLHVANRFCSDGEG